MMCLHPCCLCYFFFSSRRRHTRSDRDWSSDVCSSDLGIELQRLFYEWDWPAGEKHLKRALELNPSSAEAHLLYGSYFSAQRSEERRVGKECRSRWSPYH